MLLDLVSKPRFSLGFAILGCHFRFAKYSTETKKSGQKAIIRGGLKYHAAVLTLR